MNATPAAGAARLVSVAVAIALMAPVGCAKDPGAPAVTIVTTEYAYSPRDATVQAGSKVTIVNQGALVHNWIIKEEGVGTAAVQPGGRFVLDLKGIRPGRYTVYCDQPGHAQAGQTGTVTVTAR